MSKGIFVAPICMVFGICMVFIIAASVIEIAKSQNHCIEESVNGS